MRRRDFVRAGVCAAVLAGGRKAAAQPAQVRIAEVAAGKAFPFRYFNEAMRPLGWVVGQNVTLSVHILGADPEQRTRVAAEIIASRPDIIVAAGVSDALAVQALDRGMPIVIVTGTDLELSGLVQSLSHPGGNVTGISTIGLDLNGKRLELLRELMPGLQRVGLLGNPTYPSDNKRFTDAAAQGRALSITVARRSARSVEELDAVYPQSVQAGDQAMIVPYNALTYENLPKVVALADQFRLPAIYEFRDYVEGGGLISFGPVYRQYFKAAAFLANKILRGSRPGDLPVEQPVAFELILNLKTAKQLGLAVPTGLLGRADEAIE